MSYASSEKNSSVSSILKKSGRKSVPGRSVHFQLVNDLKDVLHNHEKNKTAYLELVCNIRDSASNIKDDELLKLISDTRSCLSYLENLKVFVQVILVVKWAHRSDNVVSEYQKFIIDVCSVYRFYTRLVFQHLVQQFLEVRGNTVRDSSFISEEEDRIFDNLHYVIKSLLKMVPMSLNMLLDEIKTKFPFKRMSPIAHFNYVHNLLNIASYTPSLRKDILNLIINKLIYIDVETPKEEIEKAEIPNNSINNGGDDDDMFAMELDEMVYETDMKLPDAQTLDLCLYRIYMFLRDQCYGKNGVLKWDKAKQINEDLQSLFEDILLPTHASHHVQFIWFYFLSFKSTLADEFVKFLWAKVTNVSVPPVLKQASLCYISGIVARCNYIHVRTLKEVIANLSSWILNYIESNKSGARRDVPLTRLHAVFYSACHALFYLVAFRHQELLVTKKDIKFVENLNLGRIVTCRFDPLSVCSEVVSTHFASVMQKYQLTYVLKMAALNERPYYSLQFTEPWKDDFFPFDYYVLRRSGEVIWPLFRDYEDFNIDHEKNRENDVADNENEDDFLPMSISPKVSLPDFNYSVSPGFI